MRVGPLWYSRELVGRDGSLRIGHARGRDRIRKSQIDWWSAPSQGLHKQITWLKRFVWSYLLHQAGDGCRPGGVAGALAAIHREKAVDRCQWRLRQTTLPAPRLGGGCDR